MAQNIIAPARRRSGFITWLVAAAFVAGPSLSQAQSARVSGVIDASAHVSLRGTVSPRIKAATDMGRVAGNQKVAGLSLVLTPSAAQQADLKQLLVDQQTPGSSSYHRWLTPAQYAARFGVGMADIAKIENWLTAEGFTVSGVNNSRTRISFSGNATQVEAAFSTQLHNYSVDGETHLANATELKIPAALAGIASGVTNLANFRLKPRVRRLAGDAAHPRYTAGSSTHQMTPADLVSIYDIQPLYTAGFDGTGQKLAVVGQSAVSLSDIADFRVAAGLTAKAPIPVLVPGTGTATIVSGDEVESDIDLEYSGAIAQNADVYFVYTGDNSSSGVFNALAYAVDTDIAPVISISYGTCEANLSTSDFTSLEAVNAQATTQGQTIFSASGDSGATDCDDSTTTSITSATLGLAVDYPASSQYVTGVGGTMFNEGSGSYWSSTNGANGGSATSYIPEEVWNETTASISAGGGLLGGGGGASTLTTKPSWQTGTGVPSDGFRDVPDIALDSAVYHDGYLYCSSDNTYTGVTGSCANGFLDTASTNLTIAGGTSFAAPIAAGILTLVNEKSGSTGQGNLNNQLYALAASTPTAFHDITSGDNSQPCTKGTTDCASGGDIGFSAGSGYDQVTGLGTLDAAVFAGGFTATTSSLLATTTTLTPADTTVTAGTSVTITATVADSTGAGTPTGSVVFSVDGTSQGSVTLSSGTATYTFTSTTSGSHVIQAAYSGSTTYAASSGVDTVTVAAAVSTGSGTFTMSGTAATAALGGSGTSTITVTPAGNYTGTVTFSLSTSSTALQTYGCYDISDASVPSSTAVTTTLTLYTTESACSTTVSARGRAIHHFNAAGTKKLTARNEPGQSSRLPLLPISAAAALGGVLCFFRKRNRVWMLAAIVLFSGAVLGSIGCGGSSASTTVTTPTTTTEVPAGSYSVTLTGEDTTYTTITASTGVTLTVQ